MIRNCILLILITWITLASSTDAAPLSFSIERNVSYSTEFASHRKADIYRPQKSNRVGVIMIHGGAWMSGSKFTVAEHAMKLAKRGYVVMAINYRLAPKHKFPAQFEDCEQAVRWLRGNAEKYEVGADRIAAYGYSAGAQLASLLGTKDDGGNLSAMEGAAQGVDRQDTSKLKVDQQPLKASIKTPSFDAGAVPVAKGQPRRNTAVPSTRVQAVVAGGAPCEFRTIPQDSDFVAYWLGGTRSEKPNAYEQASPTTYVSPNDPPFFFFHGSHDRLVPIRSPRILEKQLQNAGVSVQMHVIDDANHLTAFMDDRAIVLAGDFLDRVFNIDARNDNRAQESIEGKAEE